MRLHSGELGSGIRLIKRSGTLDIHGVNEADVALVRHCTGKKVCVLVDLSKRQLRNLRN